MAVVAGGGRREGHLAVAIQPKQEMFLHKKVHRKIWTVEYLGGGRPEFKNNPADPAPPGGWKKRPDLRWGLGEAVGDKVLLLLPPLLLLLLPATLPFPALFPSAPISPFDGFVGGTAPSAMEFMPAALIAGRT